MTVKQVSTVLLVAAFAPAVILSIGCGSSSASTTATATSSTTSNTSTGNTTAAAYAAAYKAVSWGSATMVSYPTSCTMTFNTTGVPTFHADYYLAPASSEYPTIVAYTPVTNTGMSVVAYTPSSITSNTVTVNICPSKASTTTTTSKGVIGYMLNGEALFNAQEAGSTPAMSDNVSYTFTNSAGIKETASFIDACNSHPTPLETGYSWHYHGLPNCITQSVDGSSGASHLIGFALDGFPIYGGRDVNGNIITTSQLDSCDGITSATPEFPSGAYHYVLPIGVTNNSSSLPCYAGTVSATTVAAAQRLACSWKMNRKG